jgi:hypothetical protein
MYSPGLISINTGVYFMEDSGILYVKKAESSESHVKFVVDHSDCMQAHHRLTERSCVTLKNAQYPDWKKEFLSTLSRKILSQMKKVDNEEPLESMRYYFHFGKHYFMNAFNCLHGYAASISVKDVQTHLDASSSNRKLYGRNEFDPRSLPLSYTNISQGGNEGDGEKEGEGSGYEAQDTTEACVTDIDIAMGDMIINDKQDVKQEDEDQDDDDTDDAIYDEVSSDDDDDVETKNINEKELEPDGTSQPEKKKIKRTMKHGFQNTVFDRIIPYPTGFQGGLKDILPGLEDFGATVLGGMGYRCVGETVITDDDIERETVCRLENTSSPSKEETIVWHVTIVASASYQVDVALSASLKVLKVSERPLSWVSGTLLAGVDREIGRQAEEEEGPLPSSPSPSSSACTPASPTEQELTPPMAILKAHDVRAKLTSSRDISPEDDLYHVACPGGMSPIDIDPSTLLPVPSHRLCEGHRVTFVKKLIDRTKYVFSDTDIVCGEHPIETTVNISRCLHFEGDGLTDVHCVGDMSLDVDISALIEHHREGRDYSAASEERIDCFLLRVNTHALEISDRIEALHVRDVCASMA